MTKKERYDKVLSWFRENQPSVETELHYSTTFQLLVAVILSAQCTDKRVNMITPTLFNAFPTPQSMAEAEEFEILEYVKSVSYPNAKAQYLSETSKKIVAEYNGEVPSSIEDLTKLPGVGRKTANVMLAVAFGKSAMAVDTHIYRVSHRLGLVSANHNTPYKVESELIKNIPEEDIPFAHHWLLLHGRYICTSQTPKCAKCQFDGICPKKLANSKL